jgi:four helix bundle protein
MRDFTKLNVWGKAHTLTLAIYKATAVFPKEELYGLTSQMRRAGVSVPANIAEGCGKTGDAELSRYLLIAMGSANELNYYLILTRDLKMLKVGEYDALSKQLEEVKRMLSSLVLTVRVGTKGSPERIPKTR